MNIFTRIGAELLKGLSFVECLAKRVEAIEEFLEKVTSVRTAAPVDPSSPPPVDPSSPPPVQQ